MPASHPALDLIYDQRLLAEVERSFQVNAAQVDLYNNLRPSINCNDPPVGISFRVFTRLRDREWELGRIISPAHASAALSQEFTPIVDIARPATIDLILRPDPAAAAKTLNILSCWNREVILKDVPVEVAK